MRMKEKIFAHEKVQFNLVRFTKFGKNFEIVVDPDLAIDFKNKNSDSIEDLSELLKSENIFSDAKKGELANEEDIEQAFLTKDFFKAALKLIKQGEVQLSSEHREKLRDEKRKQIINAIHRIAIDPRSGLPHPVNRIESALNESKLKIDEYRKAEDQVQEIISGLKPVLPIRVEEKVLQIRLPMQFAAKLHGFLKAQGSVVSEDWLSDGSYVCKMKIPAGMYADLVDELGSRTKGSAEVNVNK
ncbi:ribosome assembly factor SBDS [Candidatus Woesearchaeota archaeon]|nr:ribosome assembly factor SBDS [Candidatus Woesearchaeota archaeon]